MKLATLVFGLMIGAAIIIADLGLARPVFETMGVVPHGDKLCHFLLAAVFCFLLSTSVAAGRKAPVLWIVAGLFAVATAEEYSQQWFAQRTFSLADLACNYLGIVVAGVFAVGWRSSNEA